MQCDKQALGTNTHTHTYKYIVHTEPNQLCATLEHIVSSQEKCVRAKLHNHNTFDILCYSIYVCFMVTVLMASCGIAYDVFQRFSFFFLLFNFIFYYIFFCYILYQKPAARFISLSNSQRSYSILSNDLSILLICLRSTENRLPTSITFPISIYRYYIYPRLIVNITNSLVEKSVCQKR